MSRYDMTDFEWSVIQPLLPNKPRGVPRIDGQRVLNGMLLVLRSGVVSDFGSLTLVAGESKYHRDRDPGDRLVIGGRDRARPSRVPPWSSRWKTPPPP